MNWFCRVGSFSLSSIIVLGCIHCCLKPSLVSQVTVKEFFFFHYYSHNLHSWQVFWNIRFFFVFIQWNRPFGCPFQALLLPVLWSFNFSLSPPLETMPEGREDEKQINHFLIVSSSGKWFRRDWSYSGNSFGFCSISFICVVSELFLNH